MKRNEPVLDSDLLARLAEAQSPLVPGPAAAARLKARVLERVRTEAAAPTGIEAGDPASDKATGLVTIRTAEGDWVSLAPKVELRLLRQDRDSRTFLLRLQPGAVLPPHEHPLEEECYVLEGEVRFGDIQVRAGDYHLAPKGVPHGLVRSRGGALLLLRGAGPGEGRA